MHMSGGLDVRLGPKLAEKEQQKPLTCVDCQES